MMNKTKRVGTWLAAVVAAILLGGSGAWAQAEKLKVATSIYPGWMDNWLMEMKLVKDSPTFLEKRCKDTGGKVEIVKFKEYLPSVEALVAGKVDACTMTLGEALALPEDSGVEVACLFVHDYSNGNDALLTPNGWELEKMAGKTVVGEEFSVSQYLVYRFFQKNNKPLNYMVFKNTPGDDVSKTFLASVGTANELAGATWNPHVLRVLDTGKGKAMFTSRDIPGEIVDMLVIRKDRIAGREKSIEAYVNAHYDVMKYFVDPATRDRAIKAMAISAEFSDQDVPLYSKMLDSTRFYTTAKETRELMASEPLQETQKKVRGFLKDFKALKSPEPDKVAVEFDPQFLPKE
jgi:NitT/TauT family transport system substrate-binding protein